MKSFIALSALLAVAFADHPAPAPYHPAPAPYHPAPAYKPAPYHPAPSYKEDPAVYQYQYAVSDEYAGLNFGADEAPVLGLIYRSHLLVGENVNSKTMLLEPGDDLGTLSNLDILEASVRSCEGLVTPT
ncbi:unnamed protein product [Lepeophtheirus salmonis]|uniref:(salmon louse) hypothetical protein n=1 Tax=Lepeophtheirus salmonis TaxID=72036 RepID=A0A7R8HDM5_LEPSM|nr:unnamed protein product [Lepeophtheirus salmonis]CAF3026438.1 unnamed protein product [Lepeophtheirus salmonis]